MRGARARRRSPLATTFEQPSTCSRSIRSVPVRNSCSICFLPCHVLSDALLVRSCAATNGSGEKRRCFVRPRGGEGAAVGENHARQTDESVRWRAFGGNCRRADALLIAQVGSFARPNLANRGRNGRGLNTPFRVFDFGQSADESGCRPPQPNLFTAIDVVCGTA